MPLPVWFKGVTLFGCVGHSGACVALIRQVRSFFLVLLAWGGVFVGMAGAQPVLFVSAAGAPGGDGLSWASAMNDLQRALDAARLDSNFTQIWVAQGTYRPDQGTGDRAVSFALVHGVSLLGGFIGTETDSAQRDPARWPTVLSGDIGAPGVPTDNSLHVLRMTTNFTSAVLDGFTIAHGQADLAGVSNDIGAGLYVQSVGGSITLRRCRFESNQARQGAGLYSRFATLIAQDCEFVGNFSTLDGGGAYVQDSARFTRCRFSNNTADFGGAIQACCGTVRIEDSNCAGNFGINGGALFLPSGTHSAVRSTFVGNSASQGGAINSNAALTLANCVIAGNFAANGGGVIAAGAFTMMNGIVTRNFATISGGGLSLSGNSAVANSTILGNMGINSGGGLYVNGGSSIVSNAIIWDNSDSNGRLENAQLRRVSGTLGIDASCVMAWSGALGGTGNFGDDPQLAGAAGADGALGTADDRPELGPDSACIDRGSNALIPPDLADADADGDVTEALPIDARGRARRLNDLESPDLGEGSAPIVDPGALEFRRQYPGDANDDGVVDLADLALLIEQWETAGPEGDLDGDGVVGIADLAIVIQNWGAGIPGRGARQSIEPPSQRLHAAGCQPASAQIEPVTAGLRIMKQMASATSSGFSNRPSWVWGSTKFSMIFWSILRTMGVSVKPGWTMPTRTP